MGMRDRRVFRTVTDVYQGFAPADDSGADAKGWECWHAIWPLAGVDWIGHGGGTGPGSPHYRPTGRCPDIRAARGDLCPGSKVKVQKRVGNFLAGLASRKEDVKRRCRTVL